jgi:hypothetical protein
MHHFAKPAVEGADFLESRQSHKFSLHIINPNVAFDSNWLSMKYFVWELCRFTW